MIKDGDSSRHIQEMFKKMPLWDRKAETTRGYIDEYDALATALALPPTMVIGDYACGTNISLSTAFPHATIFYVDPNPNVVRGLGNADLPANHTVYQQDANVFQPPQPLDLLVLRNQNGLWGNIPKLVSHIKEEGLLLYSHGNVDTCSEEVTDLLHVDNLTLIGVIHPDSETGIYGLDTSQNEFIQEAAQRVLQHQVIQPTFRHLPFLFRKRSVTHLPQT